MRRFLLAAAVLATLSAGVPAALPLQQQPPDSPVFRGSVQSIEVDVRVTDRTGAVVRGLTKNDFTLLEDGKPQTITTASFVDLEIESPVTRMVRGVIDSDVATNAGVGRMWVILLGSSAGSGLSSSGRASRARSAAQTFVEEALGPNDQVAVINVHGTMGTAQAFTRNRTLLLEAIDRLDEENPNPYNTTRAAYQVLEDVCNRLGRMVGRKAVLFFDPPAFFSVEGPLPLDDQGRAIGRQSDTSDYLYQRDALAAATRNNVAIYVVGTGGIAGANPDQRVIETDRGRSLKQIAGQRVLADETGGDAIVNTNNYLEGYQRFVRDSNQYYLLGYTPEVEHRDGDFHRLTVRVNRPGLTGLTVRARSGYYGPGKERRPPRPTEKIVAKTTLSPAALDALRMPLSISGLTVDLFAAPFRAMGKTASVLVGGQVRGQGMALSRGETMEIGFVGTNAEGKTSPGAFHIVKLNLSDSSRQVVEGSGLPFVDRLLLAPGRHQVKFVAHQPNGKTGMVVVDVDVPKFENTPLSMSGLLLASDLALPQTAVKRDDPLLRMLGGAYPTAKRSFSRRERLTMYLEVYSNNKERPAPVVATLARVGQPIGRGIDLPRIFDEPQRAVYRRFLPLREYEAGDYILTVEAKGAKQAVTRQVLFTITER